LSKQCIIIGCGSHASSVISIIESCSENYLIIGLIDTDRSFNPEEEKSGYKVIGCLDMLLSEPDKYSHLQCVVAIGNNNQRTDVFKQLKSKSFKLPNVISTHAFVDRTVNMGEGNIIAHGAIINAQAILGNNNMINTAAIIEHDCILENHIHIAPKAVLCGGVKIESFVMVGASATVVPNLAIATGSLLGAGALLTMNIQNSNSLYIGLPARIKH